MREVTHKYCVLSPLISSDMKHVCTRCGRSFKSNSSLDKHARSCRKKWPDLGPLGTRPHIQGPEDSRGHKRPWPDEDVEEQQGPSNAYEVRDLKSDLHQNHDG